MDAELRPLRERAHRRLRAAFRVVADRLDAAGLLRAGAQEAADSLYAIANEATYLRMTEGAGLSPERYAGWLTEHARGDPAQRPSASLASRAAVRASGTAPVRSTPRRSFSRPYMRRAEVVAARTSCGS